MKHNPQLHPSMRQFMARDNRRHADPYGGRYKTMTDSERRRARWQRAKLESDK